MITGQAELNIFLDDMTSQGKKIFAYAGFDPTADGLHIGHLGVISMLKMIQARGHDVVALIGTSTAAIGDPTGKTKARSILDTDIISENAVGVRTDLWSFGLPVVENTWLKELNFQDFMREVGSRIPLNMLLNLSLVKTRLEEGHGISLMEATYPVLQGWDMAVLAEKARDNGADVMVQVGGVDQTGNISMGIHLVHRCTPGIEAEGVLVPLVCGNNGVKMGKSEGNAIFLSPRKTDDFSFYNALMMLPDDIMSSLWSGALINRDIDTLRRTVEKEPGDMSANIKAAQVRDFFETVRGRDALDGILMTLQESQDTALQKFEFSVPVRLVDIMTVTGMASSLGAARRLIDGRGVKVDGETVVSNTDRSDIVFSDTRTFQLQKGKKNRVVISLLYPE